MCPQNPQVSNPADRTTIHLLDTPVTLVYTRLSFYTNLDGINLWKTLSFGSPLQNAEASLSHQKKTKSNKHTKQKYWSVAVLNDAARDCFGDEIVYYFTDVNAEDQVGCTITLIHLKSGQSHSQLTLVDKVKKTEQGCGTGYTYAKRYCLMGLFALGDPENDNDAQHEEEPAETGQDRQHQG